MAFFLLVSVVASIMDDKTGAAGAAISSRLGMSSTVRQAEERYSTFLVHTQITWSNACLLSDKSYLSKKMNTSKSFFECNMTCYTHNYIENAS